MSFSTWLLLAVLALLVHLEPWLGELAVEGLAAALQQPLILAVLAVAIVGYKIRHREWA